MEHDPDGARSGLEGGLDPVSVYFILFLVWRWRKRLADRRFCGCRTVGPLYLVWPMRSRDTHHCTLTWRDSITALHGGRSSGQARMKRVQRKASLDGGTVGVQLSTEGSGGTKHRFHQSSGFVPPLVPPLLLGWAWTAVDGHGLQVVDSPMRKGVHWISVDALGWGYGGGRLTTC